MIKRDIYNMQRVDPPSMEEKALYDLTISNIPQFLHYEDANSMAFGIEERVPLLDHRLIEFAYKMDIALKINHGISKYILREAVKDLLPPRIVSRRDKMGLSAPRDCWLKTDLGNKLIWFFERDCCIYEKWIKKKDFLRELNIYLEGKDIALSRVIWRILNIEKWMQLYL